MASPLSTTSSIDSVWTVCSLPTSPVTLNPPGSDAELLPRWPYGGVGSIAGTNTTGGEANLASRVVPSAPALAVPLCNAPSPITSDYQEEPPISSVPPTPSPNASSANYLTAISGDSLPVACDKLRHFLQAHYADTKPPGDLFGPFIQRLRKVNHCRLCSKVLENREQMNQHVMKHHCGHKPFACPVNEWYVWMGSFNAISTHGVVSSDHRDARQADLQKHLQKHSNVRLPCPAWSVYLSLGDIMDHSPRQCSRKLFANKRNLVRHLDQLHPKFAHELVARRTYRRRTRRN